MKGDNRIIRHGTMTATNIRKMDENTEKLGELYAQPSAHFQCFCQNISDLGLRPVLLYL